MSLVPILLVAVVMAVDAGLRPLGAGWRLSHADIAALTIAPVIAILLLLAFAMLRCERRLSHGGGHRALMAAERFGRSARLLIVIIHLAAVLVFGWLGTVRAYIGDPILLDELIAIAPALIGLVGVWWAYYPVDRRMHQAMLIRQLDEGHTVYPILGRSAYVWLQMRTHLLLTLVPVLLIVSIAEVLEIIGSRAGLPRDADWLLALGKVFAAAGVFMFAPLLARIILDVQPLPHGDLREKLLDICRRHNVRVREVLVWRTNGTMFNAAVMGLLGRLRYVLLTDALLDTMRERQVRAVMAHEIGHVRRRHLPWMIVCLLACFAVAAYAMYVPLFVIRETGLVRDLATANGVGMALSGAELVLALFVFGWISRRFERQADTFAVQHLSIDDDRSTSDDSQPDFAGTNAEQRSSPDHHSSTASHRSITSDSVAAMTEALDNIAHLNAIDPNRPSWRHGSINWRMNYLGTLVGQPVAAAPIDRTVRRIKWAAALLLLAAVAHALLEPLLSGGHAG